MTKAGYAESLKNLERISEEIHEKRTVARMGARGRGVGAEFPEPERDSAEQQGSGTAAAEAAARRVQNIVRQFSKGRMAKKDINFLCVPIL